MVKQIIKIILPVVNIFLVLAKILNNMKDLITKVAEFHRAFGLGIQGSPQAALDAQLVNLRYAIMKEENEEYLEAALSGDMVEVADALGDMLYVLCGTLLEHGMQHKIEAVFAEIHRSNMSKLDENGEPIYRADGKVIKGPNYFPPNIKSILSSE